MDNKKALEITIDRLENLKKYKHTYTQKEIVEETLEYLELDAGLAEGIKVLLNNKLYTVIKENSYSKLKGE